MDNKVEPIITISKDYIKEFESAAISEPGVGSYISLFSFLCNYVDLGPFPINNAELVKRCKAKYVVDEYKKTGLYSYNVGRCLIYRHLNVSDYTLGMYLCQIVDQNPNAQKPNSCILTLPVYEFWGTRSTNQIKESNEKFMFIPNIVQQLLLKNIVAVRNVGYQNSSISVDITYDRLIEMFVIIFDAIFTDDDLLNSSEIYAAIKASDLSKSVDLMKYANGCKQHMETYKIEKDMMHKRMNPLMEENADLKKKQSQFDANLKQITNKHQTELKTKDAEIKDLRNAVDGYLDMLVKKRSNLKKKSYDSDDSNSGSDDAAVNKYKKSNLKKKTNDSDVEDSNSGSDSDVDVSKYKKSSITKSSPTSKDDEINKLKGELYDNFKKLKQTTERYDSLQSKFNDLQNDHNRLTRSSKETLEKITISSNKTTAELTWKLKEANQSLAALQTAEQESKMLQQINQVLVSKEDSLNSQVKMLTDQLMEVYKKTNDLKIKYDKAVTKINDTENISNSKSKAIAALKQEKEQLMEKMYNMRMEHATEIEQMKKTMNATEDAYKQKLEHVETTKDTLRSHIINLQLEIDKLKNVFAMQESKDNLTKMGPNIFQPIFTAYIFYIDYMQSTIKEYEICDQITADIEHIKQLRIKHQVFYEYIRNPDPSNKPLFDVACEIITYQSENLKLDSYSWIDNLNKLKSLWDYIDTQLSVEGK